MSEEIKAYARSLGLDDRVKYLGRVTDRELLCGLYLFLSSRHFALHTAVFGIVMVLGLAFTMALPL